LNKGDLLTACLLAILLGLQEADDFTVVSGPASPRVAYDLERTPEGVRLTVEAGTFEGEGRVSVSAGLAAAKKVVLTEKEAKVEPRKGAVRFRFTVPAASLAAAPEDWKQLRFALAVAWGGGPLGQDRQRERFRHLGARAPHAGLSPDEADWMPLDLAEHEAARSDRRNRVWIEMRQPMDGKATVVVEDEGGRRVRNLISGRPFAAGAHRVEWDGLDDAGQVAPPGAYRWRSAHHPGITPEFLFSFGNDGTPGWRTGSGTDMWGPDHSVLLAVAAGSEWTFLGGSCAESGYALVAVDAAGVKRQHYNPVHGTGIEKVALAADGEYLYAANDGFSWGQHVDRNKPDWKAVQQLSLMRFDVRKGHAADFPGGKKFVVVDRVEVGPGSSRKDWTGHNLAGLASLGGKLYVSSRAQSAVLVVDPKSGDVKGSLKLADPGPLAAAGDGLLAVSAGAVVRLDPASGAAKPLIPKGDLDVRGVAADAKGTIYVSDGRSHQVKVFEASGKPVRAIGKPGGDYAGPYDPERMIRPTGLAVAPNGWLWVGEERFLPKRAVAWDTASGKVVKEKFGPTSYGASGAGFDSRDSSRWVGQGALWKVDFERKTAVPQAILGPLFGGGMHFRFHHQEGRTFLVSLGGVTSIAELKADGSIRNLAFCGSTHRLSFQYDWNPPRPFVEAFEKAHPGRKGRHGDKGPGVLWVDRSGDGQMQPDEFDFSTESENFAGAYWGEDFLDLTMHLLARVKGKIVRVTLKPKGWEAGGAPKYARLNDACREGVPVDLPGNEIETMVDRAGTLVVNSDPVMKAFAPDGRLAWTYPNRWTNVHGSHNAPLPEAGVLQGALFFLGMAPLDEKTDVFIMNGNHGRFFAISSDGLYLDEMFKDVRMGASLDAYLIGGECFGGTFGRSDRDGRYYLQSGHTDYRIFRIHGLDALRRAGGAITVAPAQAVAAENRRKRSAAETAAAREARVEFKGPPSAKDEATARWDRQGQFPARAWASFDASNLHLLYEVQDSSPWVNNGRDWTLLFKTGDSVDLQLGTDPSAPPQRSQPAPGDFRLLVAPFEGKDIAVLYRHRLPGAADPVTFTCPWRSEKVDSVKRLDSAKISVKRGGDRYTVEVSVPLADLGLSGAAGKTLRGDFGVIYGDPGGTVNMLRSYWSNTSTGLVNDVPGEVMLSPNLWGTVRFGERP
jgi:DNA-binding beta-propeller fold protein YncE